MRKIFTLLVVSFLMMQFASAQIVIRDEIVNFMDMVAWEKAHPELVKPCPTCPKKEADGGWEEFVLPPQGIPPGGIIKMAPEIPKRDPNAPRPDAPSRAPVQQWLGHVDPGTIIPPDSYGAIGLDKVVTATNDFLRIHNKVGGGVLSTVTFSTFTGVGSSCDPQLFFDPNTQRWIFCAIRCTGSNDQVIVMASLTSDPQGAWRNFQFIPVPGGLPDHPYLGYDDTKIVIGARKFNPGFQGPDIYLIDKAAFLAGTPITFGTNAQTISRTAADGDSPRPVTVYFPPFSNSGNPSPGTVYIMQSWTSNSLRLSTITGAIPACVWNTGSAVFPTAPDNWTAGGMGNPGSVTQQPPETRRLAANDARVSSAIMMNGKIWCSHHIAFPAGATGTAITHTESQYWQLEGNPGGTFGNVLQRGRTGAVSGDHRWFSSIAVNKNEDVLVGYSMSNSTTMWPSAAYSTRQTSTPANTLDDPRVYHAGEGRYWKDFGSNRARWGDYSQTHLDPVDNSLWTIQQYASTPAGSIPPDNNSRYGVWWAQVPPSVATPTPIISGAGYTLVSESCVPANGVVDPGETVTISFCLQNTGTAPTVNAVGTLQASGGVIIPGGPQNYGVIPIPPGGSVCRSFTFTAGGSCGGSITASIQVQDGASNLGTVTYNIPIGTVGAPTVFSTGNIAVPIPDLSTINVPLNIAAVGTIADVNAMIRLNHTWDSDLEISLVHPDGTVVLLVDNRGGSGDNFGTGTNNCSGTPTVLNQQAVTPIAAGTAPFAGTYIPDGNLSVLNGKATNGTWNLRISDQAGGDVGTVGCFSLEITAAVCCNVPCTVTCPANITVGNSTGLCGATVTFPPPVVIGGCGIVTVSPASGSFFPIGTTTVNVTTTAGPSCSFTITVNDTQAPTITCPANITVPNDPNVCSAVVNYPLPSVRDNCPPPVQIPASFANHGSGGVFTLQGNTMPGGVFFSITNTTGVARSIYGFGIRFGNPAFGLVTAPQTLTVWSRPGFLTSAIENSTAGWTQQGPQVVNPIPPYFATGTGPLGFCGLNTNVLIAPGATASFFIHGETACPVFNGTVGAITPPVSNGGFTLTGGTVSYGVLGSANHFQQGVTNVIANINVQYTQGLTLIQTVGLPSGSVFPIGVTTNTFQATDAAGNSSTCSFTVTVNDVQQPNITCPANQVRNTDLNQCYATFTPPQPVFSDNCGVTRLIWVMTGATTGSNLGAGINYVPSTQFLLTGTTGVGVTTVTYTAYDAAGNTRTCSFTVTVNDAQIPTINTQPATTFFCVGSNASFTVLATANGGPIAYQWQQWDGSAWVDIAGATSATYTIPNITFANNTGTYRCRLTGRCSVVLTNAATLYVNPLPTVSLVTSIPPALIPGQVLTISSNVNPAGGTYRWFRNNVQLTNPLQQGPALTGLTVDDIGTYRLVYTDLNGCVNTSSDIVVSGQPFDKLWVYPVPNNGSFQVRFYNQPGESATVAVFDSKGARVYERAVNTTTAYTRIDVNLGPAIPDGIYVVELLNAAGKRVGARKIVVKKSD